MFSRLFKTPRSSLQLFREECAETCQMYERCRQFSAETFSSLPIIRKDGLSLNSTVGTGRDALCRVRIDWKRPMYRADATKRVPPAARFCQHYNGETVERDSIQCLSVCRTTMTVRHWEGRPPCRPYRLGTPYVQGGREEARPSRRSFLSAPQW